MNADLPENEAERLAALREHRILDTPPQKEFDDLVRLAAHICDVPISAVSLIDADRQWFKSISGLDVQETPRAAAFCAHAILGPEVMVVPDAQADPRFTDNPLVTSDPNIRFYAGAPLVTEDGYALGSLCVIDRVPRQLLPAQQSALRALGRQASVLLEMGRRLVQQERLVAEQGCLIAQRDAALAESKRAESTLQAEREFTRALLESLQEGIVACDAGGRLTLFNHASREFHGLPEQPLPPEQWAEHFDLFQADGLTPLPTEDIPLFRALQGETVREAEMVIAPRTGSVRTLLASGQAIYGADGAKLGAVVAMHDVTQRRAAERELARLAAIVESSEEAILAATLDGTLVAWNRGAERLYGYTACEMIGCNASVLAPSDQESPVPAAVARLRRGETVELIEVRRVRKDGTEFQAALTFSPIRDTLGKTVGVSCVARDITARKESERVLAETHSARAESEARFRTSVAAMEEGMALQDEDGTILMCNSSAERILGLTTDQMAGRTSLDPRWRAVREDGSDFPGEQHPAMVALREGTSQLGVVMGIHKPSGELTWVNVNAVPLTHAGEEDRNRLLVTGQAARGVVVTFTDITERLRQEQALRESAERLRQSEAGLRALLESAPVILYAADANGTVTLSEGTGLTALGLRPGEAVGRSVFEFSGGDPEREAPTRRALAGESVSYDAEVYGLCLHTELRPVRDGEGAVTGIIGVCFDVTERARAEERFRVLFEQSSDAHLLFGEGGIIDCNPAAVALLRCEDIAQVLSLHPAVLSPEFQPDGRRSDEKCVEMDALAREHGCHRFEWTHRKMDGQGFPVEVTLTPVTLGDRPVLLTVWHDLTERKRQEEQIRDYNTVLEFQKQELERTNAELAALATTDGLTGLNNHRAFQERLADEAARAIRYGTPLSLIILDVDNFKQYNDAFGHPEGDAVLKTVARSLQAGARDTDLVARYGGEEFVLVLPQTDREGAMALAERLRAAVEGCSWPLRAVSASFGVAEIMLGEEGTGLLSRADDALYQSKMAGRNRVTCASIMHLGLKIRS